MAHISALPFTLELEDFDEDLDSEWTTETAQGVIRLEPDRLVIQWRLRRETLYMDDMRTEHEVQPAQEFEIPLAAVAGAQVRRPRWWQWRRAPRLEVTAADLGAFDALAGEDGLRLRHPAKLELRLQRADRLPGEEFVAELAMALARLDRSAQDGRLAEGGRRARLAPPDESGEGGAS